MTHKNIPITPVESSQIHAMGYDAETQTLAVQFKKKDGSPGGVYHYADVPDDAWQELRDAPSIGSHFYKNIKPRSDIYPFTRIPDDQIEAAVDGAQ